MTHEKGILELSIPRTDIGEIDDWRSILVNGVLLSVQDCLQVINTLLESSPPSEFLWLRAAGNRMPPSEEALFGEVVKLMLLDRPYTKQLRKVVILHWRPNILCDLISLIEHYSSTLEELSLPNAYWTDCEYIWNAIGQCRMLKNLNAKRYGFLAPNDINDLMAQALTGKQIENLSLVLNNRDYEQLLKLFRSFGSLRTLELEFYGKTPAQFDFSSVLSAVGGGLRVLKVSAQPGQDFYDSLFASVVSKCPNLEQVILDGDVSKETVLNGILDFCTTYKNSTAEHRMQVVLDISKSVGLMDTLDMQLGLGDVDMDYVEDWVLFDLSMYKTIQNEMPDGCSVTVFNDLVRNELGMDIFDFKEEESAVPDDWDRARVTRVFKITAGAKTMVFGVKDWDQWDVNDFFPISDDVFG